jgi:small subunit ribosomal protein S8
MAMTDPVADYLTIVRNGLMAGKEAVKVPKSKLKVAISEVLKKEGYIKSFAVNGDGVESSISVNLKYRADGKSIIRELIRVSKPGCRTYRGKSQIRPFRNGLGMYVLTTPKGILCDRDARRQGVGGELLFSIW